MSQSPMICPVCQTSLKLNGCTYACANGHSFDLAKEGYLNLLLSHQRKSSHPGDDKAMIRARRRFFDSGAFAPLTKLIQHSTSRLSHPTILDCGCGEGHCLETLRVSLQSGSVGDLRGRHSPGSPLHSERIGRASLSERAGKFFGVDISKEAIRCAAKRYKDVNWIVANAMRKLPFADSSMDMILSILAPRNPQEFARILKPGGKLILGVPGPNHLIELRTLLSRIPFDSRVLQAGSLRYVSQASSLPCPESKLNTVLKAKASDFEEKADEAAAKCAPHFVEVNRNPLSYELTLNAAQIADLIQMTPIFWCSSSDAKTEVQKLDQLTVTVSFVLITLQPEM